MSMTGSLQNRINPHTAKNISQSFSDAQVNDVTEVQKNEDLQTDFKSLLNNSMDEIRKEREAKKNGDLTAGSEDEFFEQLAEQTKQRVEAKNEMNKDDFLKLFVAQLQHQDPLNPDDGAEMATKLAQFNSLEQMMNMNTTLDKMVQSQNTDRNLQMVGYVGKEITMEGGRLKLEDGKISNSQYKLTRPAGQASLEIRDNSGSLVFERDLGPMDAGEHQLQWDGNNGQGKSLPDGVYQFQVFARDIEGESIPVAITSKARITGVDLKSDGGTLYSDFGKMNFEDVLSVGDPGFSEVAKKQKAKQAAATEANSSIDLSQGPEAKALEALKEYERRQTANPTAANGAP
ncbi:MAG: flagellar hook assembly protein FlgD [Oligoflexus sp.]